MSFFAKADTPIEKSYCLHKRFERRAERHPGRLALDYGGVCLTYGELNESANRLAHLLLGQGVGREAPVAVSMEPGTDMIVSLLAILKAGGAYMPIDPRYPISRINLMLKDSGTAILLTNRRLRERFDEQDVAVICPDDPARTGHRKNNPLISCESNNLASLFYTSGSTGRPKAVGVTHESITRLACDAGFVSIVGTDHVLQATNLAFDAANFEIWGALLNGAVLYGLTREAAISPELMARKIRDCKITVLYLTTAVFNRMTREYASVFAGIPFVATGGETASFIQMQRLLKEAAPTRLLNLYGPTEGTTFTTSYEAHGAERGSSMPIGKPLHYARVHVLDRDMRPVTFGETGELYISGRGLARGYVNRPDRTAGSFLPNPFSDRPGDRLYRTGDLALLREDGLLDFIGRRDHQVKIQDHRIEPDGIARILTAHPSVREVVVQAYMDGSGEKVLLAYVVPCGRIPTADSLAEFLRGRLPEFMVPADFVFLDAIPVTTDGRPKREELPMPVGLRHANP